MSSGQMKNPIKTGVSSKDTSMESTAQSSAYQKVPICQRKCDSRKVPRASLRFT